MTDATAFPPDLDQVPEGERIAQAFGWAPFSWALIWFTLAQLVAFQSAQKGTVEFAVLALALGVGLLLLAHEIRRRRQPKALVRRGEHIAIFARGHLHRVVPVAASHRFNRHPSKTWGPILYCAMGTVGAGIFLLPGKLALAWPDRVAAGLACAGLASLCLSVVRTRLFCEDCRFPYTHTDGFQSILVARRDVPRVFSPKP